MLVSRAFELRLLKYLGYEPVLDHCVHCQATMPVPLVGFAPDEGGMLCRTCAETVGVNVVSLKPATVSFLHGLYEADLRAVARQTVDPVLGSELGRLLFTFIQMRAEKPLKSLSFLQSLLAWTPLQSD